MGYLTFILRSLLGRPVRTALTALGLAVAVASVVLLSGIAWGFERSMQVIYRSRGIDLIVVRAGISDQLSSNLDADLALKLAAIPGVRQISPSLMDAVSFEEANLVSVLASGWEPDGLLVAGLKIIAGRPLRPSDRGNILLGRVLALNLDKSVGDEIDVAGEPFHIVGVYESPSLFENGGLVIPISELQHMMGREGQVTGFVIVADPGVDPATLGRTIEKKLSGIAAMPARDYIQSNVQIRLARSMAWATTAVALAIGSIGLLNTMAMAVFERTGEIGLLRAIGWKRRRIILLLLGEAGALGALGACLGIVLAYVGLWSILLSPTSRGFIAPSLPPAALALGLVMGVGLTLLGGVYPAVRASRLEPSEALRHE